MSIIVRSVGLQASESLHEHAERRLEFSLGRLLPHASSVVVRVADENGPKGGNDKRCRIVLQAGSLQLIAEATDANPYAAVDIACARLARALRKDIDRSRERRARVRFSVKRPLEAANDSRVPARIVR